MEFSILYFIQGLHSDILDKVMLMLTDIVGSYGYLWIAVGVVLCLFNKTRKCGFAVLLSYILVFLIGQYALKDVIARIRPCNIDDTVELLVSRPKSFSCPSTHSAWSFGGAMVIWYYFRKAGIFATVFALIVGFSRLYLFVHFPTDVLLGFVLGAVCAFASDKIINLIFKKIETAKKV